MHLSSLLFCFVSFAFLLGSIFASEGEEDSRTPDYDYEIYELIDRMNKLTPAHSTFYDLLQVSPSSPAAEVSRQFRRLASKYHPDKTSDPKGKDLFQLYSGAAKVLKTEAQRTRYEWLINEAPAWHRSQVYMMQKLQRRRQRRENSSGPELSLYGVLVFIVVALTVTQLILQWSKFAINRYWIWSGNRAMKAIPVKEMRRMEKKAMRNGLSYLAYADTNFENMAAARTQPLSFPSPADLFIFAVPISIIKFMISLLPLRRKMEEKTE